MCMTSFSQPCLLEKPLPEPIFSNLATALLIIRTKMQHISTVVMYPPYVMLYTPCKKQVPSCPACLPFLSSFRTNFCIPSSPPMNLMWDLLHVVTFHCSLDSVHQDITHCLNHNVDAIWPSLPRGLSHFRTLSPTHLQHAYFPSNQSVTFHPIQHHQHQ